MPYRQRPRLPAEWHVPEDPKKWVTWAQASKKLRDEEVYWISTSSLTGKPHAAPVWGIWKNDRFYFETDPSSVKGKNLAENPRAVVHVQDGQDTVIVEGVCAAEKRRKVLSSLRSGYLRKYDYGPDWSGESSQTVFQVKPKIVHAWRVPRMHQSLVNFLF